MKSFLMICLLLATSVAFGQEGHEAAHAPAGVPWSEIGWQVLNLGILFGALFYYLKKPAVDFFRQRQAQFTEAAQKSQAARMEAEKQFLDIKHRIEKLESNKDQDLARANAEAADLRKQMIRDAEETAARIKHEAETTVSIEVQRAKQELHEQFVREAVAAARTVLTKDIGNQDQQRLQSDFMKNIQAVNP